MAAGGGTQSLRKAIGVIKDSTKVGLAKVNSDYKDLDIAIVKATNHDELLAKEKHVRTIFRVLSSSRPREDVAYCLHALARRLAKTHNWIVALKTLVIIHRALRESDPSIREELLIYSQNRSHMLNLSHFRDDSGPIAWDCSAWVRTYALYIEERLECFRVLRYDVQNDCSKNRELHISEWLEQLPTLQLLLYRLLACQPHGAARYNFLVQYALSIVATESVKIYVEITAGILNLVDKFFEMPRHNAVRALEIYKKSGDQAVRLSEFFETCRGLEFGKDQRYIHIEQPPESFICMMEEYVKEAPQTLMLPWRGTGELGSPKQIIATKSDDLESDHKKYVCPEVKSEPSSPENTEKESSNDVTMPPIIDLMGWDELTPETSSHTDDQNVLALAIDKTENEATTSSSSSLMFDSTNWELALVATTCTYNETPKIENKLAGGLDLDSLYNTALPKPSQNFVTYNNFGEVESHPMVVGTNPFEFEDSFYSSSNMVPYNNMQTTVMDQQQQTFLVGQQQEVFMIQQHQQESFLEEHQQQHQTFLVGHQQEAFMTQQQQQLESFFEEHQHEQQQLRGHEPTNCSGNPFL